MRSNDGHQIRGTHNNGGRSECNRWTELQERWNTGPAENCSGDNIFRMLNDPEPLVHRNSVSPTRTASQNDVERAKEIILKCEPSGVTPLACEFLERLIRSMGMF
jgi:hypothetical protein